MAVETTEYLKMLRRMIRAAGKRVGDADEPELAALLGLQDELEQAITTAVAGQLSIGRSWASIAAGTGTTRQAAHARFAPKIKALEAVAS